MIDEQSGSRLADAARLRNVLVHVYLDLDQQRLWEALQQLDDLVQFAAAVVKLIEE